MAATPANSLTLISSGLADARIQTPRGQPDINQFVNVIKKTTRWSAQWCRVDFDGSPEFGQRVSMTLPRIGELVSGFTLAVTMPDIYAMQIRAIQAAGGTSLDLSGNFLGPVYGWTNSLGHALIQQIEVEIGGAIVETLDGVQLEILDELYETIESAIAKNAMIKRAPHGFNARTWLTPQPLQVFVPIPFWFSRPGVYGHALPLEALKQDGVRIHVTFRPISQLFYTDARVDSRTPGYDPKIHVVDGMWPLQNGRFWQKNPAVSTRVYSMNAHMSPDGVKGELIPNIMFPQRFSPIDAYALVEYISLEEYEASVFRTAELTYHVEQHVAVPVEQTLNAKEMRLAIPYSNPTKEITWVLQRPEVAMYNAWFLFTRDLSEATTLNNNPDPSPCSTPWWPDAYLLPTPERAWQIQPAFQTSYSEPLLGAMLLYNAYDRFVHEGASFFRSFVPAMYYVKSAVHDRYVYAYNFGQKAEFGHYGPKGAANWDKIPRKELYLTLNKGRCNTSPPNLNIHIYVTVWNVFKVFGGRGGMLFTN